MRVVRLWHSGVVTDWRARERHMVASGVDLALLSPKRFPELSTMVELRDAEPFVHSMWTRGHHPYLFVFGLGPLITALRRGADVIDLHEEPASLAAAEAMVARWLTRRSKVPVVFFSAQNIFKRYPPPFRWLEGAFLRRAAAAYVCNEEAGDVLRRKGFRGLIEVLPLGVDSSLFDSDTTSECPEELVIGYAGRLDDHKGVDVLLEAIALVPHARARIVGDGDQREALEALVRRLQIEHRVEFHGAISRDDIAKFFSEVTALAVPSIPTPAWKEQFGRVAAEAMTVGTPVIASGECSLPDVVGPGGIIVPPGDAPALADAIRRVGDAAERTRLSIAAREWAQQFRWEAVAAKHIDLYERVAGTRA